MNESRDEDNPILLFASCEVCGYKTSSISLPEDHDCHLTPNDPCEICEAYAKAKQYMEFEPEEYENFSLDAAMEQELSTESIIL